MDNPPIKGMSLFTFLLLVIFVLAVTLFTIIIAQNINSSLVTEQQKIFLSNIKDYDMQLMLYIAKNYDATSNNAQLDGKMLEDVIDVNTYFKNKFKIKSSKIVGIKKNLSNKDIKWLKGILEVE